MVPCSPLPFFQSNDLPLAYGSYYTFDLYLSMSRSCNLQLTVVLGCDKVVVVIETLTQQNIQSMFVNEIDSFAGTALYNKLSPTSIWIAVDACGLFYVEKVGVAPITSVFNMMMMGLVPDTCGSTLHDQRLFVTSNGSDWQVSRVQWQPLATVCPLWDTNASLQGNRVYLYLDQ